ncbi:MAG: patatin-like phospholipase family protein [Candidatus Kapaibacterium sp.]|jgi:NTE family protein
MKRKGGVLVVLLWILAISSLDVHGQTLSSVGKPLSQLRSKKPKVALVLSGGGAKGLAHIGVLDIFDSAHIPIELIVGTSMGAAIGGLYAAGYSPRELERFALTTNWQDVLDLDDDSHRTERLIDRKDQDNALLSLRFTGFFKPVLPTALSSGERLTMLLNSMVINAPGGVVQDFLKDLRVPFVAVATDIVTGTRRLISHGDLTSALRASITLPLRFIPLSQDSAILVDGGLLSNVPVDIAKDSAGALITIASNTTAGLRPRGELNTPWDVADQVITLMMQHLSAEGLKNADFVVTPGLAQLGVSDFQDVPAIIEAGRVAARRVLPSLLIRLKQLQATEEAAAIPVYDSTSTVLRSVQYHFYGRLPLDTLASLGSRLLYRSVAKSNADRVVEQPLLEAMRAEGFTLARIDSVRIVRRLGRMDIYLDEGRIGDLSIVGSGSVHPDVVLREFPLSRQEIFQSRDADRGLRNLTSTGYFDFASLEVLPDPNWPGMRYIIVSDTVPSYLQNRIDTLQYGPMVKLTVQVRAASVIRLGVLADNEYGAQFSTELANENLFGSGTRAGIKGGIGPLSRYAAITFDAPRLFRSIATFSLQGYSSSKDISAYSTLPNDDGKITSSITDIARESRDLGARLRVGGQAGTYGALIGELRLEQQRYVSLDSINAPVSRQRLTAIKGEITIDTRNDRAFPQQGFYVQGFYEVGSKLLGGEVGYTKIFLRMEDAIALSSVHTLIPRLSLGFGDLTLPRMEQFSVGGIESFYGLHEDESRGRQMLVGSLTYQIGIPRALFFPTYFSLRYDVGQTWLAPEAIKFEALVHGLGAQVGLKTPFGLARFGIGENFRFSKNQAKPVDLNKPLFYFSIGANL